MTALRQMWSSNGVAILRYHAICDPETCTYAAPGICVSAAAFERHIQHLVAQYAVVPLHEAVDRIRQRRPLPANAVAITFDDGYADNLVAARILHRYGATGTFYVTAGCVAGQEPFWPVEIRQLLERIADRELVLDVDGHRLVLPCSDATDRQSSARVLSRFFKSRPLAMRERVRQELRRRAGWPTLPRTMLTVRELEEMQALGMTIGAHTVTHPNLPSAGPETAWQEIEGSKALLETRLASTITMFSYPNGGAEEYFTPAIQQMVRRAGFLAASTSRNGLAHAKSDLYALERVQVSERLEDLLFALEVERFVLKPA